MLSARTPGHADRLDRCGRHVIVRSNRRSRPGLPAIGVPFIGDVARVRSACPAIGARGRGRRALILPAALVACLASIAIGLRPGLPAIGVPFIGDCRPGAQRGPLDNYSIPLPYPKKSVGWRAGVGR